MSLDDNISDDVFESVEEAEVNQNTKTLSPTDTNYDKIRPSSTGYRDYKPPSTTRKPSDPSLKIVHKVNEYNIIYKIGSFSSQNFYEKYAYY